MTKTAEELREASQLACDRMREELEALRNKLTLQNTRTAELDELIEELRRKTTPSSDQS